MLLEARRQMKKRKPKFIRQAIHKKAKLEKRWKKPRGIHSKIGRAGHQKAVSTGYGSPQLVKGLSRNGLNPVMIRSLGDIKGINKEKDGAVISSALGNKKRIEVLKEIKKRMIKVINIKNVDECIKKIEDGFQSRKEQKKKEKDKKKDNELVKRKEDITDKLSEEEKKEKDKKDKDKLLIKRDIK